MRKKITIIIILLASGFARAASPEAGTDDGHGNSRPLHNAGRAPAGSHSQAAPPRTDSNIHGHAIDVSTGDHIPYVSIALRGTTIGITSDATGHFILTNLPAGRFTVVATCVGYTSDEKEIILERGRSYELNFDMSPSTINMDQVVVSSSRNQENRRYAPTIVNIMSQGLFESTSSNTLSDALSFQSGLRMEMTCNNCGVPQLRINGLDGQYSQILLDSRPLFSSLAAVYGLEQLPIGMVERVEVIRGGGSALYGSSAIGGVVNIITREPVRNTATLSNNTSFLGSSSDVNTSFNASLVTDDQKAGVFLFGMIRDRQAYDRNGDGFSDIPKLSSETIGFRGYYRTGNFSKLTAEYHHIREYRRGGDSLKLPPHEANIAEQLRHGINGGGLKFDIFSRNYLHKGQLFASYQDIARDSYFGTGQDPDAYGTTSDGTLVAGGQYSYSFRKLWFMPAELTAGAEFNRNDLHDVISGYDRDLRQISTTVGGYLQNEWRSERMNLIIGARVDKHNKIDNVIVSPRTNIRYSPSDRLILRAGYTSGYRAPQAYDEDLHVGAVGGDVYVIELDDDLKPEYSHSVTGSVDLYATAGKIHTNLLIEGFYTTLKDVFTLTENGTDKFGNLLLLRENASGARIGGVNLEFKAALSDKNYLQAGYTWQQSRYKEPFSWSENPALEPRRRMLRTPDNYGYVMINFAPFKDAYVTLNGTFTGNMLVPHYQGYVPDDVLESTSSFADLGFRLAYDFRLGRTMVLQINAGMKNVLDSFQTDLDRGADKDAGYIYGPAYPRTVFFGVKLSL